MALSLHTLSAPVFLQFLGALDGIVGKAEAHCTARKISPDVILFARLYPDMFHFTRQVQIACDFAMKTMARLSGKEPEKVEDGQKSFAELHALIARAATAVKAADAAVIDGFAEKDITFPLGKETMTMKGHEYFARFALPNFYFHATTAYAILRENGVELGKRDFMGQMAG